MTPQDTRVETLSGRDRLAALFLEVSTGLQSAPRRIPEKLFYDERGSELFEEITGLEAYYLTRLEIGILERCLDEVRRRVGPEATIVEFGSGSGKKTSLLLENLDRPATCVPVDISETQLFTFADELVVSYPQMTVAPVVADFTQPFFLPGVNSPGEGGSGALLFFFPGSSIGNFEPDRAHLFLERIGNVGGPGSSLLLGVDLLKPRAILERAYDDPQGVTARFNRNALHHLNRVFQGDFDVPAYEHRAVWNARHSRIEMQLLSSQDQEVILKPDLSHWEPIRIRFRKGETLVTEHSYKYDLDRFTAFCRQAGWKTVRRWTDDQQWFSVFLLEWEG